jgi:DNA-binding MarR family transcriptional regulator
MSNVSNANQYYELWVLLQQASDAMFEARENELREYGITAMQAAVLYIVKAIGDEATPAQVSRWILRKPHSVSGILQRMEKAGLVKKTKDLTRRNMVRVTMTDKGRQALSQSMKRKSFQRILSSLSENERQQLRAQLRTVRNKGLKEIGVDPRKMPFPK